MKKSEKAVRGGGVKGEGRRMSVAGGGGGQRKG